MGDAGRQLAGAPALHGLPLASRPADGPEDISMDIPFLSTSLPIPRAQL